MEKQALYQMAVQFRQQLYFFGADNKDQGTLFLAMAVESMRYLDDKEKKVCLDKFKKFLEEQ